MRLEELYIDPTWLHKKYWDDKLNLPQIAKICRCDVGIIHRRMKKYSIPRRTYSEAHILFTHGNKLPNYITLSWLRQKYIDEDLQMNEIAKLCNCSAQTITNWINQFHFERKYRDFIWLHQKYIDEKLSIADIAKLSNRCEGTIRGWLSKYNILRRPNLYKNSTWLRQKYIDENLNMTEIAKLCDCSSGAIVLWMGKHNIPIRTRSQAKIGSLHPLWNGGSSREPYDIKFSPVLKRKIRRRDGYICQKCGILENGKAHDVHHIDYDKQNSIPENLITLCRSCHIQTNINREYWIRYFRLKLLFLIYLTFLYKYLII